MAKQKTIPELEAEKAENERRLSCKNRTLSDTCTEF